jgi:hypothetical protein
MLPINKITTGTSYGSNVTFAVAPTINYSENSQEVFSSALLIRAVEEKDLNALRNNRIEDCKLADEAMERAISLGFSEVQQVLLEQMPNHDFFICLEQAMKKAAHPNSRFVKQIMDRVSDETLKLQIADPKKNLAECYRNGYRNGLNVTAMEKEETDFLSRVVSLSLSSPDTLYGGNLPVVYKLGKVGANVSSKIEEILSQMDSGFFAVLERAIVNKNEGKIQKLLSDSTSRDANGDCIQLLDFLWDQNDELNELRLKNYMLNHVKKIFGEDVIKTILKKAVEDGNAVKIGKVRDLFVQFFDRFIAAEWTRQKIEVCINMPTPDVWIALLDLKEKTEFYPIE